MINLKANAKLNLFLDVVGTANSFHNLSSVAMSIDIFDLVEIQLRQDKIITVNSVLGLSQADNIAFKAASGFLSDFNTVGCNISIEKCIAEAGGLGGSSADAAAVIFGLMKLHKIGFCDKIRQLCNRLGSDVLFMLKGGLGLMSGRGDEVRHFECPKQYHFAVTTFCQKNSTRQIFEQYDKLTKPAENFEKTLEISKPKFSAVEVLKAVMEGNLNSQMLFNALEPASKSLSNFASDYLEFCKNHSLHPSMTGSGSAYFLLCKDQADACNTAKLLTEKGFNTKACKSVNVGVEE